MTSYRSFAERERRLVVLRLTAEGSGIANDRLLRTGLAHWGLGGTLDQVRTTIAWLTDNGFLTVRQLDPDILRVTITRAGRDLAEGRATHPDVTPRTAQVD